MVFKEHRPTREFTISKSTVLNGVLKNLNSMNSSATVFYP
jgi:hypothetical protein